MWEELILAALKARENAYAPYSHYQVGAAVLTAYGATCCAERTAVFQAVSAGKRKWKAVAIAGGMEGEDPSDYAYPCGICRQVLSEFGGPDLTVIVAKSPDDYREYSLGELLPSSFGGDSIK